MAIGDVRPSGQIIPGVDPRIPEGAFGEGIARGVKNFAAAQLDFEASEFELREMEKRVGKSFLERDQKIERARASADLIRLRNETAQETEELRRNWPDQSGRGFTEAATKLAQDKLAKFNAGLSPEIQTEFQPRIAEFETAFNGAAFETELNAGDTAFTADVADITQKTVDEILQGTMTFEDGVILIDDLLENSPLAENATQSLAEAAFESLQLAAYSVEVQVAARDPLSDRGVLPAPDPATGLHATGLPPEAAGFLGVTGGTESGNQYNRLFSHQGVRTFSDFSKHPNSPAPILKGPNAGKTSTAAGRYQIIKETWDRAAAALGLTDFSPASQDRAAWWIAQEAYSRTTRGGSLSAALRSGDPVQIEQARRILSGETGSGVVYEGLQGLTKAEFFNAVTSGRATPGSIVSDPRFDDIPFSKRMAAYTDAVTAENTRQAEIAKQQQEARDASIAELIANINLGRAGESDIFDANRLFNFNATEFDKINTAFEKAFSEELSAQKFQARLASPTMAFDATVKEERDEADTYADRAFSPIMQEQDEAAFNNAVVPMVDKTRFVPTVVRENLIRASESANPQTAEFGFRGMQTLFETDPQAFEIAFGDQGLAQVNGYISAQIRGQSTTEFQEEIRQRQMNPNIDKEIAATIDKFKKDNPGKVSAQQIMNDVGGFTFSNADPGSRGQVNAMLREYNALLSSAMLFTPDPNEAHKTVITQLQGRYAESRLGDNRGYILRRPVENHYPPVNESHAWTEQIARRELGIPAETVMRFVSDGQTEAEIRRGEKPSYMVYTEENGIFVPKMQGQTPANSVGTRFLPARIRFDQTEEMKTLVLDETLLRDEIFRLNEENESIRSTALRNRGATDEDRARISEIEEALKIKQQQLEEMERAFK